MRIALRAALLISLVHAQVSLAQTATAPATTTPAATTVPANPLRWWPPAQRQPQRDLEAALNAIPLPASLRAFHDLLGSEPHIAGTPGDARNIQRMVIAFRMMGLDVQVHEFWAYLATPIDAALEIVSPDALALPLKEAILAEDKYCGDPALTIGFNAYSGSGDVTGEIVYANYGAKADFEKLKELGIDCTGKIVIARYGGNFRGYKAKFAQAAGAAGLIIYTDPDDAGYRKGVAYPEGGWANETCIQRGSLNTLDYPGDPLTPGIPAAENAPRLDPQQLDLPHIPVQPIGWGAAREIMLRMKGTPLPVDLIKTWQGGLPCAYRLMGGPELRVRLMVKQERSIKKSANVIGTLRGALHPDQEIIVGCHHDAWCHGAGDPLSGTMLLFEAARSFAQAAKDGFRPARSVVFAAWGGEEYGMIGSTEYCEQYAEELRRSAVAYINLDAATMGPNFSASAAPSLRQIIDEVTNDVPQARAGAALPPPSQTVHQAWLGDKTELGFGNLGGGSDHIGFYCHLGIPACGLAAEGSQGTAYHSNYDDLAWYRKIVGEGYQPALMLTRVLNLLAVRLANARLLPLDPTRYAPDARIHLEALQKRAAELKVEADFAPLKAQIDGYEQSAQSACRHLEQAIAADKLSLQQLESINQILLTLERQWLAPEVPEATAAQSQPAAGDRPWFRNLYAASDPDSGYAAWMLPGLRAALERKDAAAVAAAGRLYDSVFEQLAGQMIAIESALAAPVHPAGRP